ncbi:winged helix-turn-helix domain-containing protein [Tenacibaculum agarivorans]|uniref:winged helix-turn-helix domain-containing protein n=1 Tax=Tenacibaculum agarivorans TaxID=1908389 RepID=UPI00094B8985|nr:winged helix-turn-helix domain-containing protein [Tenacibaculum agarivorans]
MTLKSILLRVTSVFILILCLDCKPKPQKHFSEMVKVALRNVGHQLLVSNENVHEPVLPIQKIEALKYKLSFTSNIEIKPSYLVKLIDENFEKVAVSNHYIVEVLHCNSQEVSYSYIMKEKVEEGIIPCVGRRLQKDCYTIQVTFLNVVTTTNNSKQAMLYYLIPICFMLLIVIYVVKKRRKQNTLHEEKEDVHIGDYLFYPERNIIVYNDIEISLSKKECELLQILGSNKNQTVKREELTKRVWEDNGVIVGRSLDTYISKLRKKLNQDPTIKISNIHGVGYKLIVE